MSTMRLSLLLLCVALPARAGEAEDLQALKNRFAPVDLEADVSKLPDNEKAALGKTIEAAEVMDSLFLRQDWAGAEDMLQNLLRDDSPLGRQRLSQFLFMKGPWDRVDANKAFIPGAPPKPEAADFYPADATKAEIAAWFDGLPAADKERATGFFTVIRRTPEGKLSIVPYSVEYQNALA